MPNPPSQSNLDNFNFKQVFSYPRLYPYINAVSSSPGNSKRLEKAKRLYEINMIYCECLYPSLHTLEISLRNSIDQSLQQKYNVNWFIDNESKNYLRTKHNIIIILPNSTTQLFLETREKKSVINSIVNIIKNRKTKKSEKIEIKALRNSIIAELTLGVWTGLLCNKDYLNSIFIPCIKKIFPHARNTERSHSNIDPILKDINNLRNRVFHHEPIWRTDDGLKKKYDNIYKIIKWIDPNLEIWLKHHSKIDRFLSVYDTLSKEIEELTGKNFRNKVNK